MQRDAAESLQTVAVDFAWKDLVRVCLQLYPIPQYVVLTNQRDLQLYDLARDREAPRLAIRIDDLPKYSEAFPFFTKELNQLVAEDEEQGRKVRGPGLPDHLDPKDSRWFSTDCIEPPPVES